MQTSNGVHEQIQLDLLGDFGWFEEHDVQAVCGEIGSVVICFDLIIIYVFGLI